MSKFTVSGLVVGIALVLSASASADQLVCYKNMAPTIPPPTGPQWSVFLSSADGRTYSVTATRNGRQLYGGESRSLVLYKEGHIGNGWILYASSRRTVTLMINRDYNVGQFQTAFYEYNVVNMTCNDHGGIPESAPVRP